MNDALVIHDLRQQVPEIEGLYEGHHEDNDALLPHVFMADIARFAERMDARAAQGSRQAKGVVDRLLEHLERAIAEGDQRVKDLIAASFVETLDRDRPRFEGFTSRFGVELRAALERQRGLYGEDLPTP
jgi:hypothetical protein